MEEGLKKRLVGAAVLASLVVIFLPMLIDEPTQTGPDIGEIPPPPAKKEFASSLLSQEVERPKPLPVYEPQVEPEPRKVVIPPPRKPSAAPFSSVTDDPIAGPSSKTVPKAASAEPPSAKQQPRPGLTAWVVKVGSFSNRENAEKLVKKLRKAGFQTPDAERVEVRGKTLYRVAVGPMVRKEKAEKLLPKIDQVSGTKGQVRAYR